MASQITKTPGVGGWIITSARARAIISSGGVRAATRIPRAGLSIMQPGGISMWIPIGGEWERELCTSDGVEIDDDDDVVVVFED